MQGEVTNGDLFAADMFKTVPSFPNGVVDSNHNGMFDGGDKSGVLLGDVNGNGLADPGEDVLFFSTAEAQALISTSDSATDVRQIVAREALAAQLNIYNNAGFDGHSGSKP